MVNEKQGKVYRVIRAGVQKQFGQHNVSQNMAANFERIRKGQVK